MLATGLSASIIAFEGTGRRSEDEDDERVFVLGTGVNRFMPQWDGELLGPANTIKLQTNYAYPPQALTPDQLSLYYCAECHLTWLKGNEGAEAVQSHPSHHTYQHIHAGTSRSLVVFTDVNASMGIYFGPESKYNISQRLRSDDTPTNQVAEIAAAIEALRQVRQTVEPARRAMLQRLFPQITEDQRRDIKRFRLIVATDSSYVVECMSKHIKKWSMEGGIYKSEQGRPIQNSDGFAKLTNEVDGLSMVGVQVAWYHVPRGFNQEADGLARAALRS
ncbi:hypothetical protein F4803DRAFT_565511 [Xylaria telfairii]|nr:hypothetical protein F4803DRAFT_565511 [Xylaria telfairii]